MGLLKEIDNKKVQNILNLFIDLNKESQVEVMIQIVKLTGDNNIGSQEMETHG